MPELPEVETTVRDLAELIVGLTIRDAWNGYDSAYHYGKDQVKDPKYFAKFKRAIVGQKIVGTSRRGKNVLIHLEDGETILVHMKMTGHFLYGAYEKIRAPKSASKSASTGPAKEIWLPKAKSGPLLDPFNGWIRLVFTLSNGKHLALSDLRKFAKVTLVQTAALDAAPGIAHIGPDMFDPKLTSTEFMKRLQKYPQRKIKQTLMDQTLVGGIGNIYSDEALWLARIHPQTPVHKLPEGQFKLLYKEVKAVLQKGIDFRGDSMSDYRRPNGEPGAFQKKHNAYRRTGKPCNRRGCAGIIERTVVAGRSAHFCPICQKR